MLAETHGGLFVENFNLLRMFRVARIVRLLKLFRRFSYLKELRKLLTMATTCMRAFGEVGIRNTTASVLRSAFRCDICDLRWFLMINFRCHLNNF